MAAIFKVNRVGGVAVYSPAFEGSTEPIPDTEPPVMSGSISVSLLTQTSYTLTIPVATDNVGVTGIDYSLNAGVSYTTIGVTTTINITGRTAGTTDQVRVRARDAAGNLSTLLQTSVTLLNDVVPEERAPGKLCLILNSSGELSILLPC